MNYFLICFFSYCWPKVTRPFLTLASRSFIVLCFPFRSVIPDMLNFVMSVRSVSDPLSLSKVHLFQHHLLKTLFLLHCIAFAPVSRISWPYTCQLGFAFCSLDLLIYFFHHYHYVLNTAALYYITPWSWIVLVFQLCSFLSRS